MFVKAMAEKRVLFLSQFDPAYESGNSPEMIHKYYLDLVTPEQAKPGFHSDPRADDSA